MKDNNATSQHGDINSSGYSLFRLRSQLPKLAFKMFDVGLTNSVKPHLLDHLKQPKQPRLKFRWQRGNFGINRIVQRFHMPFHGEHIAYPLFSHKGE